MIILRLHQRHERMSNRFHIVQLIKVGKYNIMNENNFNEVILTFVP